MIKEKLKLILLLSLVAFIVSFITSAYIFKDKNRGKLEENKVQAAVEEVNENYSKDKELIVEVLENKRDLLPEGTSLKGEEQIAEMEEATLEY